MVEGLFFSEGDNIMQDKDNNRYTHTGPYLKDPIEWIPESALIKAYGEMYRYMLEFNGMLVYFPNGIFTRIIVINGA